MKKATLKIFAAIATFIGIVMLVFKSSSRSSSVSETEIDDNNKKLEDIKNRMVDVIESKEQTKSKIQISKDRIKDTVSKKKNTKSAINTAKDFKDKYKSE